MYVKLVVLLIGLDLIANTSNVLKDFKRILFPITFGSCRFE